jgi:hypothetical protein
VSDDVGVISIRETIDGSVSINLSREDLLELYSSLQRVGYADSTFASDEVTNLIRRFFCENQDVKSDPDSSLRFFDSVRGY